MTWYCKDSKDDKNWPYYQQISPLKYPNMSFSEIDKWCDNNIGSENVKWRRTIMTFWEFKTTDDLIAFKLTWANV